MNAPDPTQGPRPGTRPSGNAASRYFFLFLVGLVVGIIATVMALRALDARKDHYPDSVMQVMSAHVAALSGNIKQNRCTATDTLPHLQALRTMANDLEPGFPDLADDERFATHASTLRATLDAAIASPPQDCAAMGAVLGEVGEGCKGCHQDFRS